MRHGTTLCLPFLTLRSREVSDSSKALKQEKRQWTWSLKGLFETRSWVIDGFNILTIFVYPCWKGYRGLVWVRGCPFRLEKESAFQYRHRSSLFSFWTTDSSFLECSRLSWCIPLSNETKYPFLELPFGSINFSNHNPGKIPSRDFKLQKLSSAHQSRRSSPLSTSHFHFLFRLPSPNTLPSTKPTWRSDTPRSRSWPRIELQVMARTSRHFVEWLWKHMGES